MSADLRDGVLRVLIPGHFSPREERHWVDRMVEKMAAKYPSDPIPEDLPLPALRERAAGLARRYLDGSGVPSAIMWVTNQTTRWASATPAHRTIRLSHRLQGMPDWVVDYVILHEMAHLIEPSHSAAFWRLLAAYPRTETAKAFLDGASFASRRWSRDGQPAAQGPEDPAPAP
ncbi:M48 family metallopeptidase [uncultured Arthrobacter sp.]|uniref:M48 metallopeptidase family protein n=1 Tax=uncultured Arthrobacter sp. TaxID=114050 RepID=UPI0026207793|nr:M48 family metallopeptidase [uncultured Arthrobacter sp.]